MNFQNPLVQLFVLALPVACIAWTVTHEEIFKEPREYCADKSKTCPTLVQRKLFYLLTCEYCFSHYVTALLLFITGFQLLYIGWRGYIVAGFSLVWIANFYMTIFGLLRQGLKKEKIEASLKDEELKEVQENKK